MQKFHVVCMGDTRPCKEALKEAGFKWSSQWWVTVDADSPTDALMRVCPTPKPGGVKMLAVAADGSASAGEIADDYFDPERALIESYLARAVELGLAQRVEHVREAKPARKRKGRP